jgi:hypothetical protein
MSTVIPTVPVNPVPLATENTVIREERHEQLPVDKFVRATVAEGGQERVMLELNHRLVPAETRVPLKTGQQLNLLVTSAYPQLELQIIDDPLQKKLAGLLHLLGEKSPISSFIRQLTGDSSLLLTRLKGDSLELLQVILAAIESDPEGLTGGRLAKCMQRLGLNLETLLADGEQVEASLKTVILEIMAKLDPAKTDFAEQAERVLLGLELFQFCQLKFDRQDIFFLPLPFGFLQYGFIVADRHRKKTTAPSEKSYSLSMYLALESLGNVRVDFLVDANGLYLRFICDSKEKMEFAAQFKEELHSRLQAISLQGINFSAGAEDPVTAVITKMMTKGDSVLDTRI